MNLIIYCLLKAEKNTIHRLPKGIDGLPVKLIKYNEIYAAVSSINQKELPVSNPPVSLILAYENVIEAFYKHTTILPMRYGSFLEELQVIELLEKHHEEYLLGLKYLKGCTEFGIRMILPVNTQNLQREKNDFIIEDFDSSTGSSYLKSLKKFYLKDDKIKQEDAKLNKWCSCAFAGIYKEYKLENSAVNQNNKNRLLSFYFLVWKEFTESFKKQFRELIPPSGGKILMSGPWPPYNFVANALQEKTLNSKNR
ncbi:MAG: GvpL/GvpF family gas vesicle protein [Candidatus Delongbacteria bacterium]|nr:GvpL/GvpF family gas vesicle protein [Candidatus Delongbacteria bacterium]